jgi:hypothetical protein
MVPGSKVLIVVPACPPPGCVLQIARRIAGSPYSLPGPLDDLRFLVLPDVAVDSGDNVQMKPQALVTGKFLDKYTGVKVIRNAVVGYNNIDVRIRSGYTRSSVSRERFRGAGGNSNVRVRSSVRSPGMQTYGRGFVDSKKGGGDSHGKDQTYHQTCRRRIGLTAPFSEQCCSRGRCGRARRASRLPGLRSAFIERCFRTGRRRRPLGDAAHASG